MVDLSQPDAEDLSLPEVLAALGNPIRLDIVRRLAAGEHLTCSTAIAGMPKSSASHHWRTMRESGLLHQYRDGRFIRMELRTDALEQRFPGLLGAVLGSS